MCNKTKQKLKHRQECLNYPHGNPQAWRVVSGVAHRRHSHSLRTNNQLLATKSSFTEAHALTLIIEHRLILGTNPSTLPSAVVMLLHRQEINSLQQKQRLISHKKKKPVEINPKLLAYPVELGGREATITGGLRP